MMAQQNKKIDLILVEENLQKRNNISSRLRTQGFSVDSPSGGFHAIKVLEENEVKSVVLCSDMDDMSIAEIATIIRSMPGKKQEVKVFFFVEDPLNEICSSLVSSLNITALIDHQHFSLLADALKKVV